VTHRRSSAYSWWLASRPKTLAAAAAPVLVGSALAAHDGGFRLLPAAAALAGALLIQVGTNFANDVLDFRRGADDVGRLGPTRVVQAGLLSAGAVSAGAAVVYCLAAVIGLYLVRVAGWPVLVIGVTGILSGVLYTAGPYPLGYVGLGDAFVMLYFGLAAVAGTYFVQTLHLAPTAIGLGVAVGCLATAILVVNNLRDIETDRQAGKRTLAVRLGARATRGYYVFLVALAFAVPLLLSKGGLGPGALLVVLGAPFGVKPARLVAGGLTGAPLNGVLGLTARLQMAHAAFLCLGLLL